MPKFELRKYQQECIDRIAEYCARTRSLAKGNAHRPERDAFEQFTGRDSYYTPEMFKGVPYFCLRVPTGGGKTLIAAHSIGAIARHLGHTERPLCLWVTPSTAIRDQTLRGLKDRNHPYHAAIRESYGPRVQVLTIEEAQYASKAMISSDAVIIVTTIQSYRIDNEDNRKVYQGNGYLMDHFRNLPDWVKERLRQTGADESGKISLSLANAMKLRGPIVIMDEAQNARTKISFESLARFGPLAVLELTATPHREHNPEREQYASNILHAVSALEVQRAGMIKLPIELESRKDWLEVLRLTIEKRNSLAEVAEEFHQTSGRFIRPIAVIQAQPRSKKRETHTAEVVKQKLIDPDGPFKLNEEAVKIAIGTNDELGDIDLLAPDCQVEYVITVDKLREGWDCPFAYVLGSIGNLATETAVEQLLGRVLRMPHAKPTEVTALDRAYAIVQSEDMFETAGRLRDSLVQRCGFDRDSVKDAFRTYDKRSQRPLPVDWIPLEKPPRDKDLPSSLKFKIDYDQKSSRLDVHGALNQEEAIALRDATQTLTDRVAVESFWSERVIPGAESKGLDEYADPIRVPQLALQRDERLILFEPDELDEFEWNLDACDPEFDENELDLTVQAGTKTTVEVDEKGGARIGEVVSVIVHQLEFLSEDEDWDEPSLIRWLNREIHRGQRFLGLTSAQTLAWIQRVLRHLIDKRGSDLAILGRKRIDIADALIPRISAHGRAQVRAAAEQLLSGFGTSKLITTDEYMWNLEEMSYVPYHTHSTNDYQKHAFTKCGAILYQPEIECAKRIDSHPNVKRWVRNLESENQGGFSLPLSPGRFFPDFICELNDGRIALVEYKGSRTINAEPEKENHKKAVGELWAANSESKAVFVWVVDEDWKQLDKLDSD